MPEATNIPEAVRGNRKERVGEVITSRMHKTLVVRVERRFAHPKFKKVVSGYKKYYAHDETGEAKVGDIVRIEETRPLSKTKRSPTTWTPSRAPRIARIRPKNSER